MTDYVRSAEGATGDTTVNFHGSVTGSNVGWNSGQLTQTATTTTGLAGAELDSLIDAIKQALPVLGLSEEESTAVRRHLETVEAELESGSPTRASLRRC